MTFLETPLANYGEIALDWAGSNKLLISLIVILALTADVFLPVPNGLTNTFAGMSLGWATSSLVVWIGLNIGASIAYLLGRFAGRSIVKKVLNNNELIEAENKDDCELIAIHLISKKFNCSKDIINIISCKKISK